MMVPELLTQQCQHRVGMERIAISVGGLFLWSEEARACLAGTAFLATSDPNTHPSPGVCRAESRDCCVWGWEEQTLGTGELAANRETRALVIEYPWPEQVMTVKITSQPCVKSFRCVACRT